MNSFFSFVILATLFCTAKSLKCFSCSTDNGNCFTGSCENGTVCFKRETVSNGRTVTFKGCETALRATMCVPYPTSTGMFQTTNCQCVSEWCNRSSNLHNTSFLLFVVLCCFALLTVVVQLQTV